LDKVLALRSEAVAEARTAMLRWLPNISRHSFRASALNLATYLALQKRDVRSLQQELIPWGLSALGCSATDVLANLDSVIAALSGICGQIGACIHKRGVCRYAYGERRLERNAVAVLGPRRVGHTTRIMVTVPPRREWIMPSLRT
jgi:pyruvate kinase